MVPKDPVMLLSFVNLKLRDMYKNPEDMCEDLDVDISQINSTLASVGYKYDPASNQYK